MRGHAWLCGAALVACSDGDATLPLFDRHCDSDEPVPILELAPSEHVGWVHWFDEEHLHVSILIDPAGDDERYSVVVPECGGQPRAVAPNLASVFMERGALFGCDRESSLVLAAHLEDAAPVLIAERGCFARSTEVGLVAVDAPVDAEEGRLLLVRVEDDGSVAVDTLLEGVRTTFAGIPYPALLDGQVFVYTSDDALWAVDLASKERVELLAGVLEASITDRHVLYRPIDAMPDGVTEVRLHDRETGEDLVLGEPVDADLMLRLTARFAIIGWGRMPGVFSTKDGRRVIPPPGTTIGAVGDDDSLWLWSSIDDYGRMELLRWPEGRLPEPVHRCYECYVAATPDGVLVMQKAPSAEDELWYVPTDEGPAERIAAPIGASYRVLDDLRVLTMLESDVPGDLLLYDRRGGGARVVASDVAAPEFSQTWLGGSPSSREIAYEQRHADGTRTLYRARLAEQP